MLWLELLIFLLCIVLGARIGGIGMGTIAGIGLIVFVFLFRMPQGGPPVIVLGMILAVITALAAMESAGGLAYLLGIAEKILRKNPKSITFLAPLVTYILILASGTQHVIYALLPIIGEISRKAGIRPERPLSISVIAAMHGLIASPISAATVALLGVMSVLGVSLPKILLVIIPATFLAVIIGSLSVAWRGKKLAEDTDYQNQLQKGIISESLPMNELSGQALRNAKGSVMAFFTAVIMVVLLGMFPNIRPTYEWVSDGLAQSGKIDMGDTIILLMLAIAGVIMLFFKANAGNMVSGDIMKSGIIAIVSILGISWLGSSFFEGNRESIVGGISSAITDYQWVFGVGLFALSILLFSQAATVVTLMPVGVALGIPLPLLIAVYPAVNGYFFLPTYGTVIAAVNFDLTGTTRIGKYLVNHSFMLPGLVTTLSAVLIALLLSAIVF
ncbi:MULTISPECIES: anaerobic C4-dicarboxylate transporter family protein [unclassified Carboxylicivirga]|uniref:anaerobic C4-dicarboxylate transporter family protein n=1 Tax=Carboxylicivirga TaxID=1628153 RepID=UPI003D33E961